LQSEIRSDVELLPRFSQPDRSAVMRAHGAERALAEAAVG
jgi:hypothetical protein